jgi:hypothetical protein
MRALHDDLGKVQNFEGIAEMCEGSVYRCQSKCLHTPVELTGWIWPQTGNFRYIWLKPIFDGGIVEVCANSGTVIASLALPGRNSTWVGIFGLPSTAAMHAEAWELTPLY